MLQVKQTPVVHKTFLCTFGVSVFISHGCGATHQMVALKSILLFLFHRRAEYHFILSVSTSSTAIIPH